MASSPDTFAWVGGRVSGWHWQHPREGRQREEEPKWSGKGGTEVPQESPTLGSRERTASNRAPAAHRANQGAWCANTGSEQTPAPLSVHHPGPAPHSPTLHSTATRKNLEHGADSARSESLRSTLGGAGVSSKDTGRLGFWSLSVVGI